MRYMKENAQSVQEINYTGHTKAYAYEISSTVGSEEVETISQYIVHYSMLGSTGNNLIVSEVAESTVEQLL
jgi:hypothetical protein